MKTGIQTYILQQGPWLNYNQDFLPLSTLKNI